MRSEYDANRHLSNPRKGLPANPKPVDSGSNLWIYSGVVVTLAVVVPSIVLKWFAA